MRVFCLSSKQWNYFPIHHLKKGATFLCNSKQVRAFFMLNDGLVGGHLSN